MLTKERAREILGRRGNRWLRSPERFKGYFDDALALLIKKGWCQGAYARSRRGFKLQSGKDKNAASFCGQGALERVTPEDRDYAVCKKLLAYALGCMPNGRWSVASVNDDKGVAPEVAKATIIEGYRATILILDELA